MQKIVVVMGGKVWGKSVKRCRFFAGRLVKTLFKFFSNCFQNSGEHNTLGIECENMLITLAKRLSVWLGAAKAPVLFFKLR